MHLTLTISVGSSHLTGDALEQVEVLYVRRTYYLLQRYKLRERRHIAAASLHKHIVQRCRVKSVFRCSSHHDTIHLTKLVEVAYV